MRRITPNLNSLARESGYRRPEDLIVEDAVEPIHRSINAPDYDSLSSDEQRRLYTVVNKILGEAAEEVKKSVDDGIEYALAKGGRGNTMYEYVKRNELDLPSFILRFGYEGLQLLDAVGLKEKFSLKFGAIDPDAAVVVYQMPKPLAQYWFKRAGISNDDVRKKETLLIDDGQIIPWGNIYRSITPVIWKARERLNVENRMGLGRVNDLGEHDPSRYYYIWVLKDGEEIHEREDEEENYDRDDDYENSSEYTRYQVPANIMDLLTSERDAMTENYPERPRTDMKYTVLVNVIVRLETGESWDDVWDSLDEVEKHALLTRLENMMVNLQNALEDTKWNEGNRLYRGLINPLEHELYGIATDESENFVVNSAEKLRLEQLVQEENLRRETAL